MQKVYLVMKVYFRFTLLFIFVFPLTNLTLYSQKGRGIDDKRYMKKQKVKSFTITEEEDSLMQILNFWKVKDTTFIEDYRLHKKAVKSHLKYVSGGGKDLVSGKKTYKRLKKSKREAKYTRF